jgi:hypothetical protein
MEAIMHTETGVRPIHDLIASDRVEGAPVRDAGGIRVGTIKRVMIEKATGSVAYAVLRVEASIEKEPTYLRISWPRLTYDRNLGAYRIDLVQGELGGAPGVSSPRTFDRIDRKWYWGIAENWQT